MYLNIKSRGELCVFYLLQYRTLHRAYLERFDDHHDEKVSQDELHDAAPPGRAVDGMAKRGTELTESPREKNRKREKEKGIRGFRFCSKRMMFSLFSSPHFWYGRVLGDTL